MSGPTIRAMKQEDIPQVSAVDRLCFPVPWSPQTFAAEIRQLAGFYLVAELRGRIVGYIGSWMVLDEVHIATLGVHPDLRRRHIAARLLLALLEEATRRRVRRVTLEVRASNTAARELYQKYGFEAVGVRHGYYSDNGEDAILMWIPDLLRPEQQARLREIAAHLEQTEARAGS
ncbi:MAG: ribosomal protein S18-alanine N-acetyltransferase [Armatimonadetes bacterium]|nr:ribosomal protein S18-alanine N-acetyltransferase [Armatimonadota bacterium]